MTVVVVVMMSVMEVWLCEEGRAPPPLGGKKEETAGRLLVELACGWPPTA